MEPPSVLEIQPQRVPPADFAATLLAHTRVADRNCYRLQRQLKNVIDGVKGGWNWNVGLPRLLRREERYERIIHRRHKPATIIFPIHAEASAMSAALPGEHIVEMEPAPEIGGGPTASDLKTGLWNGDLGSANAE